MGDVINGYLWLRRRLAGKRKVQTQKTDVMLKVYCTNATLTRTYTFNETNKRVNTYRLFRDFFRWFYGRPQSKFFSFVDNNGGMVVCLRDQIHSIETKVKNYTVEEWK